MRYTFFLLHFICKLSLRDFKESEVIACNSQRVQGQHLINIGKK